jgi:hypothetical protein
MLLFIFGVRFDIVKFAVVDVQDSVRGFLQDVEES